MKIAITTACNASMTALAAVTMPNREAYCKKNGYGCLYSNRWAGERNAVWSRIALARSNIKNWDWLCLADVDLIFMNHKKKLEDIVKGQADLITSYDANGLNAGVVFIKNTAWAIDFLEKWWDDGQRFSTHPSQEQAALAYLLYREPKTKWEVRPQREFNSFLYELYPWLTFPEGQYQAGDFVLHLPSVSNGDRIRIFQEYLPKVTS